MPRTGRIVVSGYPHHIVHRGHNRQAVFAGDDERRVYLANLLEWKEILGCEVYAYCLMTNHVHLVVNPGRNATALALLMKRIAGRQTRLANGIKKRSGTLWEGRFKSSPISTDHYLLACCRYVELNPVRAGIVDSPQHFFWSSFRERAGLERCTRTDPDPCYLKLGNCAADRARHYREWVMATIPAGEWDRLRRAIRHGHPTGDDDFLLEVSRRIGRPVEVRSPGRPKKIDLSRFRGSGRGLL